MNEKIDRDHVSEHLSALVQGELVAPQRERIEEHIRECAECAEELRGVRALLEMEEVELEEVERARLHAAVAEAVDPTPSPQEDGFGVWVPPRRSVWSRFAPSLGAAALLLVAVIAGLTVAGDGAGDGGADSGGAGENGLQVEDANKGGSDEKGGGGGGQPTGSQPAPQDAPAGTEEATESTDATDDLESRNGRTLFDYLNGRPPPRFVKALALGKATEGRSLGDVVPGQLWESYARAYNARDAARFEKESSLALKDIAPDDIDDRVKWCGNRFRAIFDQPLLAVYGSVGRFDTSDTLVLGFLSSEKSRGPLTSYVVGAWSGRCNEGYRHLQGPLIED